MLKWDYEEEDDTFDHKIRFIADDYGKGPCYYHRWRFPWQFYNYWRKNHYMGDVGELKTFYLNLLIHLNRIPHDAKILSFGTTGSDYHCFFWAKFA